ncbi:MAG TPA: N-acetylmuramoyl-L-alanine amidase [Candidatus Paceibacterota bacterium]
MRYYVVAFLIIAVFIVPSALLNFPAQSHAFLSVMNSIGDRLTAAVGLAHNPVTIEQVKNDYATATLAMAAGQAQPHKVRILIVPGHEPTSGGAEGYGLKERDMTVELAQDLIKYLKQNEHYEVFTTRDTNNWTPDFANYFKTQWEQIKTWTNAHVVETRSLQRVGEYAQVTPTVHHTKAAPDVALRLYGVNKWANENDIDIALHIHFNDYPGHAASGGKYSGFTIYVPEKQYFNSTTSKAIAGAVFKRLARYNPVSNLPGEDEGIVEEQDLIAIGAFNSVDAASMLTEYGYLYEQRFQDPDVRHRTLDEMAYETYLGLLDFFDPSVASSVSHLYDTQIMPYQWTKIITGSGSGDSSEDIFALQTALILDGDYPPTGKTMNECPRSGSFGPCTKLGLSKFQAKYDISGEQNVVGPKTIEMLNKIYGSRPQ